MRINKNFRVKGQHITCTDDTRIIKGNKNLYYAVFHVDELWDGIELKACFTVDEESYIMPLERIGKTLECEIPYPANSGVVFGVGIFGGDLISTDIVYASTTPGIPIDGENPPEPVPDWFNKMEGIAKQAMETANSIKEQADSGAFNGKPFTYDDFTEEQLKALEGKPGYTPQKNIDYFDGKDGYTPQKGIDYFDGEPGYTPQKGIDYFDGEPGATPQKGVDYFTPEEVNKIVNTVLSQVEGTEFEEKDPTVPDWAKASEKPTYTAEEVGARPNTWTPSASDVGADPSGTAAGAVSSHNTAEDAHADIRELIEQITTGKVSVSDIIDNLTTNVANKPLSAAQGVALKALIDANSEPLIATVTTGSDGTLSCDKTYLEIVSAIGSGKIVLLECDGSGFPLYGIDTESVMFGTSQTDGKVVASIIYAIDSTNTVVNMFEEVDVTDDRINTLIDAKLGVIENGSY